MGLEKSSSQLPPALLSLPQHLILFLVLPFLISPPLSSPFSIHLTLLPFSFRIFLRRFGHISTFLVNSTFEALTYTEEKGLWSYTDWVQNQISASGASYITLQCSVSSSIDVGTLISHHIIWRNK